MKKHAYLIMAHNNFSVLEKLIQLIDDSRNDIYIHIDLGVKDFDFEHFRSLPKKSKLYFTNRTNIAWGGLSLVKCKLILLEASTTQNYDYYHLLSGVDLPLKSQDDIHDFFSRNSGKEFIGFTSEWDDSRVKYLHLFSEVEREKTYQAMIKRKINKAFISIQKLVNYDRTKEYTFYKGSNWFSITNDLAKLVVSQKEDIERKYKYTFIPDEFFLQTIVHHSPFKNNLFENGQDESNMRCIDWERGDPYTYRKNDFAELMNSDKIFARKFDEKIDNEIMSMIYEKISNDL